MQFVFGMSSTYWDELATNIDLFRGSFNIAEHLNFKYLLLLQSGHKNIFMVSHLLLI
jgi:hypothetical protein